MATILIVEDERPLHEAYRMVLEKAGYDVLGAYNGQEALDLLTKHQPALILLDLRMPKMGGIEFLQNFGDRSPHTKIVVFSNLDTQ